MRFSRWLAGAALALAATAAQATNGMRMIGFGPVQDAMGGVSVGAPLDAATAITNPAGMAFTGGRIDFGASYFDADVRYRATGALPGVASGEEQVSDRKASPIPAFGLVLPVNDRLAFGVGAYGVAGLGVDYPQDLYGGRTFTSYAQLRFAPGVACRILPELAVGAALNVMYGTMEYSAAGGLGMQPRDMSIAYGVGATLGLTWQPTTAWTVGLAYESRSFFQDYEFNVAQHTVVTNPGTGATAVVGPGVEALQFDQPSSATAGLGFRPIPHLLVAADLQWIRWSETNGKDQPAFQTDPALTGGKPFNLDWSDQWVVKVGAEWAALPWLSLRAGWNYGANPLNTDRAFENLAFPAIAEHHFTGGLGFAFGKAAVNLGAMYAPEVKLTGANAAEQAILAYETTVTEWTFDAGVSYRF
jgi:long-chain fatty acid transport protein